MSDFLVMSFDSISSPCVKVVPGQNDFQQINVGWGFAWYPNDNCSASLVKEDSSNEASKVSSSVSSWNNFNSSNFICTSGDDVTNVGQENAQPFSRCFGGRDWLFFHRGTLDKDRLTKMVGDGSVFLETKGNTDSELAFCYILQKIGLSGKKLLSDVGWDLLHSWFREIDESGCSDFILSDGRHTLIYHGDNSPPIFWCRLQPPHKNFSLSSSNIAIDFDDTIDSYRTVILASSQSMFQGDSSKMKPGQALVLRLGTIIWHSGSECLSKMNRSDEITLPLAGHNNTQIKQQSSLQSINKEPVEVLPDPVVVNIKSVTRSTSGDDLTFSSFKVTHSTKYFYEQSVEKSSHIIRLFPVEDQIQEVMKSTLQVSVKGEQLFYEDVFGNQALYMKVDQPYGELEFLSESVVKIYSRPFDDTSPSLRQASIPLVWMPWQRQMFFPFLLPPELPESQLVELTSYAMSFVERNDYNLLNTLIDMNRRIFEDFKYVSGSTNIETTPFEVYTQRRGVCQDFANLFICLARLLSIPARYRVGYIYTGANYENKEQSDASHAWAEVYLPYLGWRGYDPTNGCMVNKDHIRVACGRNYRDATPSSGTIYKGGSNEKLRISVKVEEVGGA